MLDVIAAIRQLAEAMEEAGFEKPTLHLGSSDDLARLVSAYPSHMLVQEHRNGTAVLIGGIDVTAPKALQAKNAP